MVREYQIPVSFTVPKPLVDQLTDIGPEVLQSFLSDTQKKLDLVSLCIGMLTLLSMRLSYEGEKRRAKKMGKKLEDLMEQVEDSVQYALREASNIML